MDFADSPERAAFRGKIRRWFKTNLSPDICVDDAADQRVAPDRETLEKQQIPRLIELAKQLPTRQEPAWNETHIRQQLAQFAIEAKALQVTRLRGLTRRLRGEPPGPEGSILKLFGSELGVRISDFASTLLGPYAMVDAPTEAVPDASRWFHRVLGARQYTIAGGTSEIQRNIIGERVLGLPKG